MKRFLIPAFLCVSAESKGAADDLVATWQADSLSRAGYDHTPRVYVDEALPTVEIPVDADHKEDPHTLLDVEGLDLRLFTTPEPTPAARIDVLALLDELSASQLTGRAVAIGEARDAVAELIGALEAFLRCPSVGSNGPGSSTLVVQDFNLRAARAALTAVGAAP